MKNIVLIPNSDKDKDFSVTHSVVNVLSAEKMNIYVDESCGFDSSLTVKYASFPIDADLIIVVGGDGSIIDASKYAVRYNKPLLGINLGKVGYLAEVEKDNLSILKELKSGKYSIGRKMLLEVCFEKDGQSVVKYAVNDIVISHDTHLGISDFKIEDSVGNSVRYRADGVIFSTPQGSTAYSLSAGGPILAHDVESILMTPVSPHSFFNRSVLFNSSEHIKITNTSDSSLVINVDGRCKGKLNTDEVCTVRKSEQNINMLTFTENSMFSSLFRKMRIIGDMD